MRLVAPPQDEPGLEEIAGKKTSASTIFQSTTFTTTEMKDLWLSARARLAISSTQDWTSAAIHRAVAHISAQVPEENEELRQQLDGVRHLLCFLGKSIEDGFKADATCAASLTAATRRNALKLLPDLSVAQKTALAEAPITGSSIFGGRLRDDSLSESSEKRRSEYRMIRALSTRSGPAGRQVLRIPTGRTPRSSQAPATFSRGPTRALPTSSTRGSSRPRGRRPFSFPSNPRGRGRGTTSGANRGRPQRRV